VPTVVLVRHGRTSANASGVLAGWSEGVLLDELGHSQAAAVADRLSGVRLSAIVSSPLTRTQQTAEAIALAQQPSAPPIHLDDAVGECHYGEWTGRELKGLAREPLWKAVQSHPSSVTFPGGEAMAAMQQRAVSAIRRWNEDLGENAVYAVVSHGDVIKAILADALGTHLDLFQRICVDPCSISIIDYTRARPFVVRSNDSGSDLSFLARKPKKRGRKGDAAVGGGAGHA
jgi:probable phosphomutase (TIGR03848 family)